MRLGRLWACLVVAAVCAGDAAAQQYYVPDYYHRGGRCRMYADPAERAACRQQRRQERNAGSGNDYQQPEQQEQSQANQTAAPQDNSLAAAVEGVMEVDARSWHWDSYDRNSVYDAQVEAHDSSQIVVFARFTYNNGTGGWARLRYDGDQFNCIELSDDGGSCRPLGASSSARTMHFVMGAAALAAAAAVLIAVDSIGSHEKQSIPEPCYQHNAPNCQH